MSLWWAEEAEGRVSFRLNRHQRNGCHPAFNIMLPLLTAALPINPINTSDSCYSSAINCYLLLKNSIRTRRSYLHKSWTGTLLIVPSCSTMGAAGTLSALSPGIFQSKKAPLPRIMWCIRDSIFWNYCETPGKL